MRGRKREREGVSMRVIPGVNSASSREFSSILNNSCKCFVSSPQTISLYILLGSLTFNLHNFFKKIILTKTSSPVKKEF